MFKISHQAIQKRAKKENWGDGSDVEEVIRRKTAEKVAGLVASDNPVKKAAAIDEEADKRAKVAKRHREEWPQVAALRQEAVLIRKTDPDGAFVKAKLAKIIAETTKIQQEGERKAWGLDVVIDPSALRKMSDQQLEDMANGKNIT
jgi:hypothetical protein